MIPLGPSSWHRGQPTPDHLKTQQQTTVPPSPVSQLSFEGHRNPLDTTGQTVPASNTHDGTLEVSLLSKDFQPLPIRVAFAHLIALGAHGGIVVINARLRLLRLPRHTSRWIRCRGCLMQLGWCQCESVGFPPRRGLPRHERNFFYRADLDVVFKQGWK